MLKIIFILLISSVLFSCQAVEQPEQVEQKQSLEQEKIQAIKKLTVNISCQTMRSPPVKNKAKIKQMLLNKGTITVEMTETEAGKIVNQFIQKKQSAYKNCRK